MQIRSAFAISVAVFGWLLLGISVFSFTLRPNVLAAFTFIPAWILTTLGILISLLLVLVSKKIMLYLLCGWIIFAAIFAEEPKSLLRGLFDWNVRWNAIVAERRLIVASLNCAGGRIAPVREMLPFHPDILLLQETPTNLDDLQKIAIEFFGDKAFVLMGKDTTIITRFEIEEVNLGRSLDGFMVYARLKTDSGVVLNVISIRLMPPVIDTDLFSADCWQAHRNDRISRQKQVTKIAAVVDGIPRSEAVIVGGDFNVTANDGCLRSMPNRLSDSFGWSGIEWGHTATNELPLFRVDQVWTSKELNPITVSAVPTKNSDHRMVLCKLEIR